MAERTDKIRDAAREWSEENPDGGGVAEDAFTQGLVHAAALIGAMLLLDAQIMEGSTDPSHEFERKTLARALRTSASRIVRGEWLEPEVSGALAEAARR